MMNINTVTINNDTQEDTMNNINITNLNLNLTNFYLDALTYLDCYDVLRMNHRSSEWLERRNTLVDSYENMVQSYGSMIANREYRRNSVAKDIMGTLFYETDRVMKFIHILHDNLEDCDTLKIEFKSFLAKAVWKGDMCKTIHKVFDRYINEVYIDTMNLDGEYDASYRYTCINNKVYCSKGNPVTEAYSKSKEVEHSISTLIDIMRYDDTDKCINFKWSYKNYQIGI